MRWRAPKGRSRSQKSSPPTKVFLRTETLSIFADLIVKPVRLLQDHPDVGEALCAQHKWILVDEYQDVNRASGVLLKLLLARTRTSGQWAMHGSPSTASVVPRQ